MTLAERIVAATELLEAQMDVLTVLFGWDNLLTWWTTAQAYHITEATYDTDGVLTSAAVVWPDGSAGTYTLTTKNGSFLAVDAFTITHADTGKVVTQPLVTRNSYGAVTARPLLTVTTP